MDSDGDSLVTYQEVDAYYAPRRAGEVRVNHTYNQIDRSLDGYGDLDEICLVVNVGLVDVFFAKDFIPEEELLETYCPRYESYVQQKALREFSSLDLNGDYSIDVLEITAWLRMDD